MLIVKTSIVFTRGPFFRSERNIPDTLQIEATDPDLSSGVTDPGYLSVNPEQR